MRGARSRASAPAAAVAALQDIFILEFGDQAKVVAISAALGANADVEYAHPNYIAHAMMVPNDPYWATTGSWNQAEDDLWGLKLINLAAAWDISQGAAVTVAVVDSGVDVTHPDLAANIWVNLGHGAFPAEIPDNGIDDDLNGYIDDVNGFDFTRSVDGNGDGDYNDLEDIAEGNPLDENGHGTHVAGTIAAVGNNLEGIIGVAPQAEIMGVRGLDFAGFGTFENLAAGIVYAALNGADVINNSWGCSGCPSIGIVEDAVRLAHSLDVVVVFAAGNENDNAATRSPQNMSETIVVSAPYRGLFPSPPLFDRMPTYRTQGKRSLNFLSASPSGYGSPEVAVRQMNLVPGAAVPSSALTTSARLSPSATANPSPSEMDCQCSTRGMLLLCMVTLARISPIGSPIALRLWISRTSQSGVYCVPVGGGGPSKSSTRTIVPDTPTVNP